MSGEDDTLKVEMVGEWGREDTEDLLREELDGFVDVRRSDDVDGRGVDVCGCKSFVV